MELNASVILIKSLIANSAQGKSLSKIAIFHLSSFKSSLPFAITSSNDLCILATANGIRQICNILFPCSVSQIGLRKLVTQLFTYSLFKAGTRIFLILVINCWFPISDVFILSVLCHPDSATILSLSVSRNICSEDPCCAPSISITIPLAFSKELYEALAR